MNESDKRDLLARLCSEVPPDTLKRDNYPAHILRSYSISPTGRPMPLTQFLAQSARTEEAAARLHEEMLASGAEQVGSDCYLVREADYAQLEARILALMKEPTP